MNRVSITGRLTKDLELRKTVNGHTVVNYQIAVQRDKDNTDFITCTTFGNNAETLVKYCHKGDLLGIEGKLQTSQYIDSENKKHTTEYILTDRVDFLSTKKEEKKDEPTKSVDKYYVDDLEDALPF